MRTILRQAIFSAQRRNAHLMERRIHAQKEIPEADDIRRTQGENQEGEAEKAKDNPSQAQEA